MFGGFGGFPFGGMGGGFEEMGARRGPPKQLDNSKYYDLLKVEKTASMDEIRKSYFKLAKTNHPDRGGDKDKFQAIQGAYEILSDKEKRDLYDKYGEEGIKEGGGGHAHGMDDILAQMMGMRRPRAQQGHKKGKPVMHPLKMTLEEIYSGKRTKIAVNRERICAPCEGKGGKEGAI